ncbi:MULTISPECIES: hypothetical protein [unclassified Exiguobacterium]|uniref:hypothetical protein n=1 Tax=unclassified Exiguobacterium TaxID=2644629 RepID=UPI000E9708BA|nr:MULTISPECIES: hypothetical protein [unclassified Exiguobacterium]HAZ39282.1 hypothetical protein [Exiguobacterium sp.]
MRTYSSNSQFEITFNLEINKIIFHDLFITLSNTDFEKRFFSFQIKQMQFIFKEIEKELSIKNVFNFLELNTNVRSQLLEQIFIEAGKSLLTFPFESINKNEDFSSTLNLYEKKLIEFNALAGKVNVNDEFSFTFLENQFKKFRSDIYTNLFFDKTIIYLNHFNNEERLSLICKFFKSIFRDMLQIKLTDDIIEKNESIIEFNKICIKIDNQNDMTDKIINIVKELNFVFKMDIDAYIILNKERLTIDLFSIISEVTKLNVLEEMNIYFSKKNSCDYTELFIENLLYKDYTFQWFVPCHIGYIESSIITEEFSVLKKEVVLKKIKELSQKVNVKNIILDNDNLYYFNCNTTSNNLDLEYSKIGVKNKMSELIDIIYFQENIPFKTSFNWNEAFCIIIDENKKYSIATNGFKKKYRYPLDNSETLGKIDFYKNIQKLKSDLIENDLLHRFFYSLNLYKESLILENVEDKILKLWNILEVITKQDKIGKIVEYSAYFPATYSNIIASKEEIKAMTEIEKSEFFSAIYSNYKEIIYDIGSLRNEFIAHKNRGKIVQEHRYERSLELLHDIVKKIHFSILQYLCNHKSIDSMNSIKTVITDIKSVYLISNK